MMMCVNYFVRIVDLVIQSIVVDGGRTQNEAGSIHEDSFALIPCCEFFCLRATVVAELSTICPLPLQQDIDVVPMFAATQLRDMTRLCLQNQELNKL